jgi:hypothetical protein
MTTPDAPREITVEEIESYRRYRGYDTDREHYRQGNAICDLAIRALSQAGGEWQPIETAPRETWILAATSGSPHFSIVRGDLKQRDLWMQQSGQYYPNYFTHWQPLPPSPSVSVEREQMPQQELPQAPYPYQSDTPHSVQACTCSKHPLWDGYDGDCPIHGWFEPVAPDTPQSVPADKGVLAHIASLIAERDAYRNSVAPIQNRLEALEAERDKLKGLREYAEAANERLAERVSVLETALERLLKCCTWTPSPGGAVEQARAALRTSEEA